LKKLLGDLVPGITELGCHPAKCVDFDSVIPRSFETL
jgi:hypothetical protein